MEVFKLFGRLLLGNESGLSGKISQSTKMGQAMTVEQDSTVPAVTGLTVDRRPSYSGSMAQIYLATDNGGQRFCIKVIRSSAQRVISSDVGALAAIGTLSTWLNPTFSGTVARLGSNLTEELDLLRELRIGQRTRTQVAALGMAVPEFETSLCRKDALVYKFVDGQTLSQLTEVPPDIPTTLISVFMWLLHYHRVCVADITPGNFLYNCRTKKLVMIDFGAVQIVDKATAMLNRQMHLTRGDRAKLEVLFPDNAAFVDICEQQSKFWWAPEPVLVDFAASDADPRIIQFQIPPGFECVAQGGIRLLQTITFLGVETTGIDICTKISQFYESQVQSVKAEAQADGNIQPHDVRNQEQRPHADDIAVA